jgi:AcrR family transcriptional regulator
MTGGSSVQPTRRANATAERREAILEAALDEFCERGFAATRVEDVARRAKVAKGTIYLGFKDKEALFQELIRAKLGQHVLRLEATRPEPGRSMRAMVEAILRPLIEQIHVTRVGHLLRLMIAESERFPELAEFYYREVVQRAMNAIERLARDGRASGELTDDALVRFPQLIAAPIVLTLVWTVLFERFAPLDRSALLGAYLDLIFKTHGELITSNAHEIGS